MNNSTISEVFNIISKSNVNQDFFHGVFESTNMKFFILGTYGFGTLGILGLLLITHFERSGNAGQFRTLVNQLVSFNLDQVFKILPEKSKLKETISFFFKPPPVLCLELKVALSRHIFLIWSKLPNEITLKLLMFKFVGFGTALTYFFHSKPES